MLGEEEHRGDDLPRVANTEGVLDAARVPIGRGAAHV
jgi:hypothetical protein